MGHGVPFYTFADGNWWWPWLAWLCQDCRQTACTWRQHGLCPLHWHVLIHGKGWRSSREWADPEIGHGCWWGQERTHSPFLVHSHLLLSAQAVCPDPILSIKWILAKFSEAPFSIRTQGAHSPIQCVSLCVSLCVFLFKYCPPHPILSTCIIPSDLLHDIPLSSSPAFLLSDAHCKFL